MSYDNNKKLSRELLEALMTIPAFRYMKAPVDTVAELYDMYPTGNERNTFAFVNDAGQFYFYVPSTTGANARWRPMREIDPVDIFDLWIESNTLIHIRLTREPDFPVTINSFYLWKITNVVNGMPVTIPVLDVAKNVVTNVYSLRIDNPNASFGIRFIGE